MKPFFFESKKATVAVIAALLTFLLSVLPIFLPDIPVEVWQQAADLIMKIAVVYLGAQGTVDAVKAFRKDTTIVNNHISEIEPLDVSELFANQK